MAFYSFNMPWNIDQIYKSIQFLIRKNQAGGIRSTDLFYTWNIEQRVYHSNLVGNFKRAANSKEGINTGLIEDQVVLSKLAPFTKRIQLTPVAGYADKPNDFIYQLSLQVNDFPCEYFTHDQRAFINDSVIDPPSVSENKYYYTEYNVGGVNQYYFLVTGLGPIYLDYICDVNDVLWSYTLDGDGRQVYDPNTSVQPLWNNDSIIEITKAALTNLGVSYKDADFTNFGRTAQATGN